MKKKRHGKKRRPIGSEGVTKVSEDIEETEEAEETEKTSKKGKKKSSKKSGGPRTPRKGTITEAVLELLAKDPMASTQDIRTQLVKSFPKTKFGKSHLAWYKYQIRQGNLKLPHGKALPPATRGRPKGADDEAKKGKKKKKKDAE